MLRLCNIQAKSDHKILTEAMELICFILCWRFSQSPFPGKVFSFWKRKQVCSGIKIPTARGTNRIIARQRHPSCTNSPLLKQRLPYPLDINFEAKLPGF